MPRVLARVEILKTCTQHRSTDLEAIPLIEKKDESCFISLLHALDLWSAFEKVLSVFVFAELLFGKLGHCHETGTMFGTGHWGHVFSTGKFLCGKLGHCHETRTMFGTW